MDVPPSCLTRPMNTSISTHARKFFLPEKAMNANNFFSLIQKKFTFDAATFSKKKQKTYLSLFAVVGLGFPPNPENLLLESGFYSGLTAVKIQINACSPFP